MAGRARPAVAVRRRGGFRQRELWRGELRGDCARARAGLVLILHYSTGSTPLRTRTSLPAMGVMHGRVGSHVVVL